MASAEIEPLMVSAETAAVAIGIGRTALFGLLVTRELESVKVGTRRLIPVEALETYVERLRRDQAEEASR